MSYVHQPRTARLFLLKPNTCLEELRPESHSWLFARLTACGRALNLYPEHQQQLDIGIPSRPRECRV